MIKSIEAVGKTEEEAISSALSQIGKERDEVSVEISKDKVGFFGDVHRRRKSESVTNIRKRSLS
jgi:predicted RNA-binding protein Jag